MSERADVICLMGATAMGKTALAVELVQRRPLEIISVDSAQVYRGMDIGTGKPEAEILDLAPHRLIDICDPAEIYSASRFRQDCLAQIRVVVESGRTPLLVGGTMLYFKALRDGLADMPHADQATRAKIEEIAKAQGWPAVHRRLAEVDPQAAQRIHPNDPQRLQRALEIYLLSGETMTQLHRLERGERAEKDDSMPYNLHFFAIQPADRTVLHERIARRFRQMLAQGLVEEVRSLYDRDDLNSQLPSIKSVGYRQVWQYLDGHLPYDGMVEKSIIATRQLAKRQLTWLRGWDNLRCLSEESTNSVDSVLNYLDTIAI